MYVTVVRAIADVDTPRPMSSTQHSQVQNAPDLRNRSSNPLKRVDTPPAVPPNLRTLPIPESALKQGCVSIVQEWPGAFSGLRAGRGAGCVGSRKGWRAARFGNRGLPAMGWHYWGRHSAGHGPALPAQAKSPDQGRGLSTTGAGNRSRTCDLHSTQVHFKHLSILNVELHVVVRDQTDVQHPHLRGTVSNVYRLLPWLPFRIFHEQLSRSIQATDALDKNCYIRTVIIQCDTKLLYRESRQFLPATVTRNRAD